jgi:hypothetical protein
MVGIHLANESDHDVDLSKWAHVLTAQASNCAAEWRIKPLLVSTFPHPSWYRATLVNDIPEAPGALAYHDVGDDGIPYMRIGVHTTLNAGESVSAALSHEVLELLVDPWCATWVFDPTRKALVAREAADPCQQLSYELDGVTVSDYVLPGWFGERGPMDRLGALDKPFTLARGGYAIIMRAGQVTQITADADGERSVARKQGSHGRSWWRQVQAALVAGC